MTTLHLVAYAITWAAAIASMTGAALAWRAQQQARNTLIACRVERRTFSIPSGGEVTVTAPMSQSDYEALKAHFLRHGPGVACQAFRPSATSEDSGLCARCGMYDYKHVEPSGA
ncbi:hypothetical protein ACFYQQ_01095 [Streptomyces sp. NPDC005496]|uniref:hypothetical protein n=1 Tax=unclassified Streptomyces TaxID=2593676 RepID=UPI0033BF6916